MKNRTYKTDTGCPKDCDCLGFGHGGLEIDTSSDDIKREVLEILEAADRATPHCLACGRIGSPWLSGMCERCIST